MKLWSFGLLAVLALTVAPKSATPPTPYGAVEYANIVSTEPPRAYILWPLVGPFLLGHPGQSLPYSIEGHTLTIYMSAPSSEVMASATVQIFRRGPDSEDNFQAVEFLGPAYFCGLAGTRLPTVYDPATNTLTITLPPQ